MRAIIFFALSIFLLGCHKNNVLNAPQNTELSIMSFNLRYDNTKDGTHQWSNRKNACVQMLDEIKPDILGIQEGLDHQVDFLKSNFPNYNVVGEINENGPYGEFKSIFFKKERFILLKSETFWLSETPEVPSKGWDANNTRIVSWVKLKDQKNNQIIYVFNTHFDHIGKVSQLKSSKLLHKKIKDIVKDHAPVFITGDFNMLFGNKRLKALTNNYFAAHKNAERTDGYASFNGFGKWGGILARNIDFIFFLNAKSLQYQTINKNYGIPYISDHYPILARFKYQSL